MRAHLALLDDPERLAGAGRRIAEGASAGFAWRGIVHDQIAALRGTGNANLIERVDDLIDLERQVLGVLTGAPVEADAIAPGAILVADDMLPSQLVTLAAYPPACACLAHGGPTYHSALLYAGRGVPAVDGVATGLCGVATRAD